MKMRAIAAASMMSMTVAAAIGIAGHASAAESWEMPDLEGLLLSHAQATIAEATDDVGIVVDTFNVSGPAQQQLNPNRWFVCYQSPGAGGTLTEDSEITLAVRRPNTDC